MILPEHKLIPPPPYPAAIVSPSSGGDTIKLSTLPPHIILHLVEVTFPPDARLEPALHRRTLYWLTTNLRLVCRGFYIACMHVLRSTYISHYSSLVKPPYTSDPFPLGPMETPDTGTTGLHTPPILSLQRETEVLDMYIALKTREDVFSDDSDLHLEKEESFNDLFMLMQPRCRTEDLLRVYGLLYGFITLSGDDSQPFKIPFSQLSVSFSPRKVGLVLTTLASKSGPRQTPAKRTTILELARDKDEKLEVLAKRLANALGRWIADGL